MSNMHKPEGSLFDIHRGFAQTEFGEVLASRVRYEKYKAATITNEQWVQLLGADVNNLTHLPLTYGLTKAFIRSAAESQPEFLDAGEQDVLKASALIHDWAEAIVGDVSFGDRTDEHDRAEQQAFGANLASFYRGDATGLIDRARNEVIFNPGSKLGQVFNAIERVGYLRTALRASEHVRSGTAPEECFAGLTWLVADVLSNQPVALIGYAAQLSPVEQYLVNKKDEIGNAFVLVGQDPAIFSNYGDKSELKADQFQHAHELWMSWANLVTR